MKRILLFSMFLLSLTSCTTQLYVPIQGTTTISLEDLNKGRDVYVQKCSSCHRLYVPSKYTNTEWMDNLFEMKAKAKITESEKQLIYQYLINAPKA